eukprot:506129-Rhodomonas_salina.3
MADPELQPLSRVDATASNEELRGWVTILRSIPAGTSVTTHTLHFSCKAPGLYILVCCLVQQVVPDDKLSKHDRPPIQPLGPVGVIQLQSFIANNTDQDRHKKHLSRRIANWELLVSGPLLTIVRMPGPTCCSSKLSSGKVGP